MKNGTWTIEGLRSGARSWMDCVVETVPPQAQRSRAANEVVFMCDSFRRQSLIRRRWQGRCRNRGKRRARFLIAVLPLDGHVPEGVDVYAPVGGGGAPRILLRLRAASAGRAIR